MNLSEPIQGTRFHHQTQRKGNPPLQEWEGGGQHKGDLLLQELEDGGHLLLNPELVPSHTQSPVQWHLACGSGREVLLLQVRTAEIRTTGTCQSSSNKTCRQCTP